MRPVDRPAQREIGEKCQRNELGIAEEHMATAISNLVLAPVRERRPRAAERPPGARRLRRG
jgi:hypothetical protein